MGIFLLILLILIIVFVACIPIMEKNTKNSYKRMGIIGTASGTYLGGFPDVAGGKQLQIQMKFDNVYFSFIKEYTKNKYIEYEDILSVEIRSEHELRNSISPEKIFMLGLVGIAGKDKRVVSNFIVIKIKYNEKERDIVMQPSEGTDAQHIYDKIINSINEYETKYKNKNIETLENKAN